MRSWLAWRNLAGAMWLNPIKRYSTRRQALDAAIDAHAAFFGRAGRLANDLRERSLPTWTESGVSS